MLSNRRQKRPEEYSTNPNTIRARRRKARLSPYSKEVEQAKASDSKAVTRAWKQRVETDAWKMSSSDERKIILETVEKEVMDRRDRRQKGLDSESKIGRFMHRMHSNGHSPLDPALQNGIHTPPGTMQPVAPMHAGANRYATPGSAMPFVLSSVEGRAGTEAPFPQHPLGPPPPRHFHHSGLNVYHYPHEHEPSPYSNMHELAHEAANNANMAKQIENLEKLVKALSDDLAVAKSTIRAQEDRLEDMAKRMTAFDNAVDRAIRGIFEMVEVAARVARDMNGDAIGVMDEPAEVNSDAASVIGSEASGEGEMSN
ncbi:hypothetical protein PG993_011772 [Apiospora rasikravindrae]|uniref:Uncharacterized protein n=1 Tax=Apiospora rasikravindrae TaxID=990691 RepID=A0ABR1S273_9PEZI